MNATPTPRNAFTPYGWPTPGADTLRPTFFMDFDHPEVAAFAERAVAGISGETARALLFADFVREFEATYERNSA